MLRMRTLVFSDLHLTHEFNRTQCDYIANQIKKVDQVVINGDFWDSYLTTFGAFLDAWQPLLSVLAEKNTIYVQGNHDLLAAMDERVYAFSRQVVTEYSVVTSAVTYIILHGNTIAQEFDARHPRLTARLKRFYPALGVVAPLPVFGIPIKAWQRHAQQRVDRELRAYVAAQDDNSMYVFGHSHIRRDMPESRYLNPGAWSLDIARFLVISQMGYELVQDDLTSD